LLQLLLQHFDDERGTGLVDVILILEIFRIGQRIPQIDDPGNAMTQQERINLSYLGGRCLR